MLADASLPIASAHQIRRQHFGMTNVGNDIAAAASAVGKAAADIALTVAVNTFPRYCQVAANLLTRRIGCRCSQRALSWRRSYVGQRADWTQRGEY